VQKANGLQELFGQVGETAAFPLAGLLAAAAGHGPVFLANAATLAVLFAALWRIKRHSSVESTPGAVAPERSRFLRYLRGGAPEVTGLFVLVGAAALLASNLYMKVTVLVVRRRWGRGGEDDGGGGMPGTGLLGRTGCRSLR
jgi:hypothetical protein